VVGVGVMFSLSARQGGTDGKPECFWAGLAEVSQVPPVWWFCLGGLPLVCVPLLGGACWVCVRFLRTQQRAESQCQIIFYPVLRGWAGLRVGLVSVGGIPLVNMRAHQLDFRRFQVSSRIFAAAFWLSWVLDGEFDPGSGRTLAACLTHASRTVNPSGGSVANG
jgi:hypothetical protein